MSTSRLIQRTAARVTNPPILPVSSTTTGNNVPKSLHKTRRTWKPNSTRYDLSSPVLLESTNAEASSSATTHRLPEIQGVKMQKRRIRDVEKAGGLEGMLLSRPSKHFTPFGRRLRNQMFEHLHRLRASQAEIGDTKLLEEGGFTLESASGRDSSSSNQSAR